MSDAYYLRELSLTDITTTYSWRNDKDIIEGLGAAYRYVNLETEEEWFSNYQNNRTTQVRLGILDKKSEVLIGMISLLQIVPLINSAELTLQIGDKNYWGKGIGKWATNLMVIHGFNNLNLNRIFLYVLTENKKAQAIYKSIGFQQEGILRQASFKAGEYKDLLLMSLLRKEFQLP